MSDEARKRILSACYRFLLPITRILLSCGIGYREFDDACRRAFVKTASVEFGLRGRETNASRVAAMTGIPRKQVQEIRSDSAYESAKPKRLLSPLADILHIWSTLKAYQDDNGRPLDLRSGQVEHNSFDDLVRECMGDVPPGAVKAELLRLGAISISTNNDIRLKRRFLIPDEVDARLESAIVYSLRGLADTIAHNTDIKVAHSDRRFERFVESRPLSEDEVKQVRDVVRTRLTQFSEELDSLLNSGSIQKSDSVGRRVGIGLYFSE